MAKYTIFTDQTFNDFLSSFGTAWEDYAAMGNTLKPTIRLMEKGWKPSEGSTIIHQFYSEEGRLAFKKHHSDITPSITVTDENFFEAECYWTTCEGDWDFVMFYELEATEDANEQGVYCQTRILHIPSLPLDENGNHIVEKSDADDTENVFISEYEMKELKEMDFDFIARNITVHQIKMPENLNNIALPLQYFACGAEDEDMEDLKDTLHMLRDTI